MPTLALGSGSGSLTPYQQSGTTHMTSRWNISTSNSVKSGAINADGTSTNEYPIRVTSLTINTVATTTISGTTYTSNATYYLILGGASTTNGIYESGAYTTYGAKTVSPNAKTFANQVNYYGLRKNSTSTLIFNRNASSDTTQNPNGIYIDGTLNTGTYAGSAIVGSISWDNVLSAAPTLTATANGSSQVDLSWTSVTNANGYRVVYKNVTDGGNWVAWSGKITTTSVSITGLLPQKQYSFMVAATNAVSDAHNSTYNSIGAQCGTNSAVKSATTASATPAPVWSTSTNLGTLSTSSSYSFYLFASDSESYTITSHSGWGSTPTVDNYGTYAYLNVYTSSAAGNPSVTVRADGPGGSTSRTFSATVVLQDAYWTDNTVTTDLVLNQPYTGGTLQAANTRATNPYSITGTLPNGLSFSTSTGDITGTPVINDASLPSITHVIGSFPITVYAYGLSGNTISTSFTLTVRYPGKFVASGTVPGANIGSSTGIRRKAEPTESGQDVYGFKPVKFVRRFNGTSWVDASN